MQKSYLDLQAEFYDPVGRDFVEFTGIERVFRQEGEDHFWEMGEIFTRRNDKGLPAEEKRGLHRIEVNRLGLDLR
jgi:hypothetical protein